MKRHLSVNIAKLLREAGTESMEGMMTKDDGSPASDQEVRKHLGDLLAKGWKLIPVGNCGNFDHEKGCQGHPDQEIKNQLKKELMITSKKEK
jgi:hypothetical protein